MSVKVNKRKEETVYGRWLLRPTEIVFYFSFFRLVGSDKCEKGVVRSGCDKKCTVCLCCRIDQRDESPNSIMLGVRFVVVLKKIFFVL